MLQRRRHAHTIAAAEHICMPQFSTKVIVRQTPFKDRLSIYMRMRVKGLQAMRFGASPAACRHAMNLGLEWSKQRLNSSAQEELQRIQENAQEHMQKVLDQWAHSDVWWNHVTSNCTRLFSQIAEYDLPSMQACEPKMSESVQWLHSGTVMLMVHDCILHVTAGIATCKG